MKNPKLCMNYPENVLDLLGYTVLYSTLRTLVRGGAAVAQVTVNHLVVGSNPTPGAPWNEQSFQALFFR